jgi:hypothetical protein
MSDESNAVPAEMIVLFKNQMGKFPHSRICRYASKVGSLGQSVGGMATASWSVFIEVNNIHRKGVTVYSTTMHRMI